MTQSREIWSGKSPPKSLGGSLSKVGGVDFGAQTFGRQWVTSQLWTKIEENRGFFHENHVSNRGGWSCALKFSVV